MIIKNTATMLQNIVHRHSEEFRELRGLFEKQLKELYWTEEAMIPLLVKCISESISKDLIATLEKQRTEVSSHIKRIEMVFKLIGIKNSALPYKAMECLIEEAGSITIQIRPGVVKDAAMIAVLQKIKHHEIACYGTMRAYALALREEDVVMLLEHTLEEEKLADLALSHIAESHINIEAADKEI